MSQAVYVAAKLEIADHLADGPKTTGELARAAGVHEQSLYRLLRALASVGVFAEDDAGVFRLSPLADLLRADAPGSQRAMALMMGEEHYRCWGDLLESVRTGETAFDRIYGEPVFDYLATRPQQAKLFDAAMTAIHGSETKALLDTYDFSGVQVLADIGGGNGSTLIEILRHHPKIRGILFDLPHVVERARDNLERAGLVDRCRVVAGDFFAPLPVEVEADAYHLRHIIHDWDDEQAALILKNIRRSMPNGARLLVVEHVLPPGNQSSFGKLLDLNMLLLPGGLERDAGEFQRLYEQAGFQMTRITPTAGSLSVVEGTSAESCPGAPPLQP